MTAPSLGAVLGSAAISGLLAPRQIGSSAISAKAAKDINGSNQRFFNEQRNYAAGQYDQYGIPFIPGLSTSMSSPLPRYSQQIGNRNVQQSIPGMRPQPGQGTDVSNAFAPPLQL
jgi:hypothetical protein